MTAGGSDIDPLAVIGARRLTVKRSLRPVPDYSASCHDGLQRVRDRQRLANHLHPGATTRGDERLRTD